MLILALLRVKVDGTKQRFQGIHRPQGFGAAPPLCAVDKDDQVSRPCCKQTDPVSRFQARAHAEDTAIELGLAALLRARRQPLTPQIVGAVAAHQPGVLQRGTPTALPVRWQGREADGEAQVRGGLPQHRHNLVHLDLEQPAKWHNHHGHGCLHQPIACLPPVYYRAIDLGHLPDSQVGPLPGHGRHTGRLKGKDDVEQLLHGHVVKHTAALYA
mmetsp:Transcript_40029/g.114406  ORF Transcript_40029/g.114406 Transcript_40029/m.114406 type:complete len:214 (+) Transcript_40029:404-1045(+)